MQKRLQIFGSSNDSGLKLFSWTLKWKTYSSIWGVRSAVAKDLMRKELHTLDATPRTQKQFLCQAMSSRSSRVKHKHLLDSHVSKCMNTTTLMIKLLSLPSCMN